MRMYPILIEPEEAIAMRGNLTNKEIYIAMDIFEAYTEKRGRCCSLTYEERFEFFAMLSCVYNAGRVQGIREERQSKKAKKRP